MTCQLPGIYAALERMPVTYDDAGEQVNVIVRGLNELRAAINRHDCPLRLLLPVGTNTEAQSIVATAFSSRQLVDWVIADLFLLRPTTQGNGVIDAAPELVSYVAAYTDAVNAHRSLTDYATITDARLTMDEIEYPRGSNTWYFGVECLLTIKEVQAP